MWFLVLEFVVYPEVEVAWEVKACNMPDLRVHPRHTPMTMHHVTPCPNIRERLVAMCGSGVRS